MLRYYEDEVRIMALRRERLPQHENKADTSSLHGSLGSIGFNRVPTGMHGMPISVGPG